MRFEIPWPPSVNHYYTRTRKGMIVGKRGVKYREYIANIDGPSETMVGKIAIEMTCYPPDRRERDLDNLNKCILDAMQKADWYKSDSQIYDLHLIKQDEVVKGGLIIVHIRRIIE